MPTTDPTSAEDFSQARMTAAGCVVFLAIALICGGGLILAVLTGTFDIVGHTLAEWAG